MQCTSCGHDNREDALFCDQCGGEFARSCPGCARQNGPGARFCRFCRTALTPVISSGPAKPSTTTPEPEPIRPSSSQPVSFADGRYQVQTFPGRRRQEESLPGAGQDFLEVQRLTIDRFEYLLVLVHAGLNMNRNDRAWGPVGRFGWRREQFPIHREIEAEAIALGQDWAPLLAGPFDGSFERFKTVHAAFGEILAKVNMW